MSQELQGLLAVAEKIVNNEFTACNCGQVCDHTCTHGKLVLSIAKAKTALDYDHRAGSVHPQLEKVFVVWGKAPGEDHGPSMFAFVTRAEAWAFKLGIHQAKWWSHAAVFDSEEEAGDYLEKRGGKND